MIIIQEEIASINLAKYRKTQQELEECEIRAEEAELAMSRLRSKSRSVSAARTGPVSLEHYRKVLIDYVG